MCRVLWGVACLTLPEPTTADDVIREFREALSVQIKGSPGASGTDSSCLPRVDLYRLVPIADHAGCRLADEDRIVAHLPDAGWSCADFEDLFRQRDDAELRYDRVRENLVSLMESLDLGEEVSKSPRPCHDAAPVLSMRSLPAPQAQQMCHVLRQENKVLRYKLNQSEVLRQELEETAEMLRREFMLLVSEIMPRGMQSQQASATASSPTRLRENGGGMGQPDSPMRDDWRDRQEVPPLSSVASEKAEGKSVPAGVEGRAMAKGGNHPLKHGALGPQPMADGAEKSEVGPWLSAGADSQGFVLRPPGGLGLGAVFHSGARKGRELRH